MITLSAKSNSTVGTTSLLSTPSNNNENTSSLIMGTDSASFDAFGGKDFFGTPDFENMNEAFFATVGTEGSVNSGANDAETAGSIAYGYGVETVGSVAYNGGGASFDAAGSFDDGGSFDGGSSFSSIG